MSLIRVGNCIFDESLYPLVHGFEEMDEIAQEAFVNHIHFEGVNRFKEAEQQINDWVSEMKKLFPNEQFRIYQHNNQQEAEVIVRFHIVRNLSSEFIEEQEAYQSAGKD